MVITKEDFYETLNSKIFQTNPEKIDSIDVATFRRVFGNRSSDTEKGIVYVFRSDRKIPRLKGESDVLYIGQTSGTFRQRYLAHAKVFAESPANQLKFRHILSQYGAIRISLAHFEFFGSSAVNAEGQLLWWYFQNHCEYPPLNYTQTSTRNDSVVLPSLATARHEA